MNRCVPVITWLLLAFWAPSIGAKGYAKIHGLLAQQSYYASEGVAEPDTVDKGYGAGADIGGFIPFNKPWMAYAGVGVSTYHWETKPETEDAGVFYLTTGIGVTMPVGPFIEAQWHVLEWNSDETQVALNGRGLNWRLGIEGKLFDGLWLQGFYEWHSWSQKPRVNGEGAGAAIGWAF